MHPSSVDLPAPFGPMRQVREPSAKPERDVVDRSDRTERPHNAGNLARNLCIRLIGEQSRSRRHGIQVT